MIQTLKGRKALLLGLVGGIVVAGTAAFLVLDTPGQDARKNGQIEVKTTPTGSTIFLDGRLLREKSNATFSAPSGEHIVKLQLAGYDEQEIKVTVPENGTLPVEHTFTKGGQTVVEQPGGGSGTTFADEQLATYTNSKYNYTIKHPKGWLVETDPSGVPHFYNEQGARKRADSPGAEVEEALTILVQPNPGAKAPRAWYQSREEFAAEDQSQIKQLEVTVNGRPAFQWDTPYGFVPYLNTVVIRGEEAFILQQRANSPDRSIYDQLIQSFTPR